MVFTEAVILADGRQLPPVLAGFNAAIFQRAVVFDEIGQVILYIFARDVE